MTIDEAIKDLDIIRFNPHWDELVKEEYWQELMEMSMNALEEVQQYRAIGTPEECRSAVEKQHANKPLYQGYVYVCPSCNSRVTIGSKFIRPGTKFCEDCGQKLDWGDEE